MKATILQGNCFEVLPTLPCILAGTSARGCCPKCGAPWERIVDVGYVKNRPSAGNDPRSRNEDRATEARGHGGWQGNNLLRDARTIGWQPTCDCGEAQTVPCTTLDPFLGSGTTAQVSLELGRACIGIDLSAEYHKLIEQRTNVTPGLALA